MLGSEATLGAAGALGCAWVLESETTLRDAIVIVGGTGGLVMGLGGGREIEWTMWPKEVMGNASSSAGERPAIW
jgi:hypothetical protein